VVWTPFPRATTRVELSELHRKNAQLVAALTEAESVVAALEARQPLGTGTHYSTTLAKLRAALADAPTS
jgi:hypothetical protein